MILLQNHFVQNELRQFIFIAIECSILDIHQQSRFIVHRSSFIAAPKTENCKLKTMPG